MTQPFGGMELLGRLSAGGMGEVLLARRRGAHGFEKLIAVKTIRGDLVRREDIRRMFLDEARLMARLDHPAIAQVYDFGEEKEVLYLAMEYVPGIVLSKLMKTRLGGLPPSVSARIAVEVCRGLHAAHELADSDGKPLGVVHRDVSPHNLMITFDGKVKILDFGIALRKGREAPETELGVVKGKATYVAPEQLAQKTVDRRSDIYSVAVVLHEMLTGKKLFSGTGNPVVDAQERLNIPAPSKIVPSVPDVLDDIVMKALAVDPDKRYQDAREMALALERAIPTLGGETAEEFASRELAIERTSHRARLQTITNGKENANTQPTDTVQVASGDVVEAKAELSTEPKQEAKAMMPPVPPPTIEDRARTPTLSVHEIVTEETPPRGGRILLALLGAAVLAGAIATTTRRAEERPAPELEPERRAPIPSVALVEAKEVAADLKQALEEVVKSATVALVAPEPQPLQPVQPVQPVPSASVAVSATTSAIAETMIPAPATASIADEIAETEEDATPPIPQAVEKPKPVASKRVEKRRAPPPRQAFGYLTFEAEPNAVVLIDGRVAGYTPLRNVKLTVGKHEIQLRKPYNRVLRLKRTVYVSENKRLKITATEKKK